MTGKIIIDTDRCKGCGMCVDACPHKCVKISKISNKSGYFPAVSDDVKCVGCARCAIICPEAVIEVKRDIKIVAAESPKKSDSKVVSHNR